MLDRLKWSRAMFLLLATGAGAACGSGDDGEDTTPDARVDSALLDGQRSDRDDARDTATEGRTGADTSTSGSEEAAADAMTTPVDEVRLDSASLEAATDDDAVSDAAAAADAAAADAAAADAADANAHIDADARATTDATPDARSPGDVTPDSALPTGSDADATPAPGEGDAAAAPDAGVDAATPGEDTPDVSLGGDLTDATPDATETNLRDEPALDAAAEASADAGRQCAALIGTYRVTYVTRAGTCGPLATHLVTFDDGSAPGNGSNCPGTSNVSPDGCSSAFDVTCPMAGGGALRSVGVSEVNEDASGATSTQVLTVTQNGTTLCSGTYDVTYVRQ